MKPSTRCTISGWGPSENVAFKKGHHFNSQFTGVPIFRGRN